MKIWMMLMVVQLMGYWLTNIRTCVTAFQLRDLHMWMHMLEIIWWHLHARYIQFPTVTILRLHIMWLSKFSASDLEGMEVKIHMVWTFIVHGEQSWKNHQILARSELQMFNHKTMFVDWKLCTIHILCGWCRIVIVIKAGHFTIISFLWQSMKLLFWGSVLVLFRCLGEFLVSTHAFVDVSSYWRLTLSQATVQLKDGSRYYQQRCFPCNVVQNKRYMLLNTEETVHTLNWLGTRTNVQQVMEMNCMLGIMAVAY